MNDTPAPEGRLRLDELLLRRGSFASRSRARDAIESPVINSQTVEIAVFSASCEVFGFASL